MATLPGIGHPLVEPNVNGPEPRLGQDRSGLIGGPASLHHDPNEVVRHQHQGVHQPGHVERLERPYISGSHNDDRPRVLDPELTPLLPLDRVNDLVRLHDLSRIRVRPRPDSDPVAADHDPATRAGGDAGPIRREFRSRAAEVEGSTTAELSGGAKRDRVKAGSRGRSREEEEENQARETESKDEADEAAEPMEHKPEDRRRRPD